MQNRMIKHQAVQGKQPWSSRRVLSGPPFHLDDACDTHQMNAVENITDSPFSSSQPVDDMPIMKDDRGGRFSTPDFEHQWLDDYLAGDDSGFVSFYHRYRALVYRYLLAHMGIEVANRLFVQTWLDFLKGARHIPADINVAATVFAEAHRLVLEAYRSLDKSLLLSFADGVVETTGEIPAGEFLDNEELQATKLASLPPAWREALQIYLETGFDGDSLAYALHVSRDTARSRLKRAFSLWRKLWPDGDTEVEDTQLRSTQHWIFRYRSLASTEPPDYLDARILRQADWQNHWLPRTLDRIDRYWHIGLTALITGLGVFGYLWTGSADPNFTLELSQQTETPTLEIPAPPAPKRIVLKTLPAPVSLAPASAATASPVAAVAAPAPRSDPTVAKPAPTPVASSAPVASSPIPSPTVKPPPAAATTYVETLPVASAPASSAPQARAGTTNASTQAAPSNSVTAPASEPKPSGAEDNRLITPAPLAPAAPDTSAPTGTGLPAP